MSDRMDLPAVESSAASRIKSTAPASPWRYMNPLFSALKQLLSAYKTAGRDIRPLFVVPILGVLGAILLAVYRWNGRTLTISIVGLLGATLLGRIVVKAARHPSSPLIETFLLWSITAVFVSAVGLSFIAIAFGRPEPLRQFLTGGPVSTTTNDEGHGQADVHPEPPRIVQTPPETTDDSDSARRVTKAVPQRGADVADAKNRPPTKDMPKPRETPAPAKAQSLSIRGPLPANVQPSPSSAAPLSSRTPVPIPTGDNAPIADGDKYSTPEIKVTFPTAAEFREWKSTVQDKIICNPNDGDVEFICNSLTKKRVTDLLVCVRESAAKSVGLSRDTSYHDLNTNENYISHKGNCGRIGVQWIAHESSICKAPPFVCGYALTAGLTDIGADYKDKHYDHVSGLYAGFLVVESATDISDLVDQIQKFANLQEADVDGSYWHDSFDRGRTSYINSHH